MEAISNEEKAREIVEQYETRYNDTRDLLWTDLEDIAQQAMEWKDEQHAKEKQQWIVNACEFWEHKFPYIDVNTIKEFVKAMKGE